MSLQERFFAHLSQSQSPVTIFLLNGVKLQGLILESDDQTLLLKRESMTQLVFKHSISTIMPVTPIQDL